MPEETKTETQPVAQYAVHSVVRGRHNRTARAALPQKPRRKQYVGAEQLRLAHGRPLIITEEQLRKNLADFKTKQAAHILEVRTLDGRVVDLETLQPMTAAETAARTSPAFPLDSVNNDKNFPGIPMQTQYVADDLTVPQVLKDGEKPALFDSAKEAAEAAEEKSTTAPVQTTTTSADIDAAVDAAQAAASEEEQGEAAPAAKEEVSSPKKGGSSRRRQ